MRSDVTVVIPYYAELSHLATCLASLRSSGVPDSSLIVVRNAPLGKPAFPAEMMGRIKVFDLGEPVGYARAVNVGVHAAKTPFVCLCDADAFLTGACVAKLVDALQAHPDLHFVGPTLLDSCTGVVLDSGIGLRRHGHFHPWLGRSLFDLHRYWDSCSASVQVWSAICSAVIAFRREEFLNLGGMDESYVDFFQDVDLCLRARQAGWASGILLHATAYHSGRSSGVHTPTCYTEMTAHHFTRHGRTWESEVDAWLTIQMGLFAEQRALPKDALWVELSSLPLSDEFSQSLGRHTRLHRHSSCRQAMRDTAYINLFGALGYDCLQSALPVVYFVDRFRSLEANQYWIAQRQGRGDIIVDRHCNILPLASLASPQPPGHGCAKG